MEIVLREAVWIICLFLFWRNDECRVTLWILVIFKLQVFWEGHKTLKNIPLYFEFKKRWEIVQILWASHNIWILRYSLFFHFFTGGVITSHNKTYIKYRRMQSFIHTVILVVWSGFCLHFGHSEEQSWNLRVSDPSRDGRFLSVPIYYGDWVPISQAKHTIESVASKIKAATSPVRIEIYTKVWNCGNLT